MAELRLADVDDREGANAFLLEYLPRHHERFVVSALEPVPAWRPLPADLPIERVCCFKYRRTVARDGTMRAGATILQLPPKPNGRSRAGQRVELHLACAMAATTRPNPLLMAIPQLRPSLVDVRARIDVAVPSHWRIRPA